VGYTFNMIRILAIMQNTWARDPDRVRAFLDRQHAKLNRHRGIYFLLFAGGSLTGKRIAEAFGDLADKMIYEEASPVVTGKASGCPPADLDHIEQCIDFHEPDIVLTFGKVATDAVEELGPRGYKHICAPHPASRQPDVREQLHLVASVVRNHISLELV